MSGKDAQWKECAKKITVALGILGRSLESWFSLTDALVSKGGALVWEKTL